MTRVRVVVSGAAGRMGSEVVRTILADSQLELVGAADPRAAGQDAGQAAGLERCDVPIQAALIEALARTRPQVAIDFTEPAAALGNALAMVQAGVRPVIGTTGIPADGLAQLRQAVEDAEISGLVAPNFAIGAVLLIKFAAAACRYLPDCEIIELHHDAKKDAPSGTALYTAEKIAQARGPARERDVQEEILVPGARGGERHGIPIHSVRLSGFVASQEVIFGGVGQTLKIRHDSIDRKSFMPGVALAARRIVELTGFYYGLESILEI